MLSVGSNNGRKVLGFNVRGEMEENELEEGEAFYQDDDGPAIGNDVALSSLSYIDEKLEHVLGHFQKDFEGCVSTENLRATYGAYGSFLPTYPRSPSVRSHESHRSAPPKMQTYGPSKSPKNFSSEGVHQNPTISANTTHSVRVLPPGGRSGPAATHVDKQTKSDFLPSANGTEELISKREHRNKSANEQKTPAVMSINFSTKNNAAIYSGLGLDISPLSSPEDDSGDNGGLLLGSAEVVSESPMTIIQTVTSFPIPGARLLSPLPESLLCLTERSLMKASKAGNTRKAMHEVSDMSPNELPPLTEIKGVGKIKMKPFEKNGRSMVVKVANGINPVGDVSNSLKKEIDIENPASRELDSNASKISLLSRGTAEKMEPQTRVERAELTNAASDLFRDSSAMRDRTVFSDVVKEAEDLIGVQKTARSSNVGNTAIPPKGKTNKNMILEDNVCGEKQIANHMDISPLKKDEREKGERKFAVLDCGGIGGMRDNDGGSLGPPQLKASQKTMSYDQDGIKVSQKEEKKKQKGQQCNGVLRGKCPKVKVELQSGDSISENKSDVAKLQESSKTVGRENQKDFPGEVKAEQPENGMNLVEKHFKDKPKDQKVKIEKESLAFPDKSKEKLATKKVEILSTSVPCALTSILTANGPTSSVPPLEGPPPPVDSWVCCDRCQQWRLLPVGMNSDDLPDKWTCSMIDWLRGMNSCTFSEEETTKARNALYQLYPPENQYFLHSQCNGATPRMILANGRHHDHRQGVGLLAVPSGEKKKIAAKDMSNAQNQANPMLIKSSNKKKQHASVKSVDVSDVDQQVQKPNDFTVETSLHVQKEKKKSAMCYPDGGGYVEKGIKQSKTKIRKDSDQDDDKISKKIKTESSHYADGDHIFDHSFTGKPTTNSSNSVKSVQKHSDSSSAKEVKATMGSDMSFLEKPRTPVQVSLNSECKTQVETSGMGRPNKPDVAPKKRKAKEWQDSEVYSVTLMNTEHPVQNEIPLNKEISDIDLMKQKKVKLSRSEGKEPGKSRVDGGGDKKGRIAKIVIPSRASQTDAIERGGIGKAFQPGNHQGTVVSQHMLDGVELSKRDLGDSQNSVAAASSSSKVSGSHKSKASCQEVKGSPVESVSSSPFRVSNPVKLSTERPNLLEKDHTINAQQTQDQNANETSGIKTKFNVLMKSFDTTSEFENDLVETGAGIFCQQNPYLTDVQGNGSADNDVKKPYDQHCSSSSRQQKSGKGSSRLRGGPKSVGSDFDKGKSKNSDYLNNQVEPHPRKNSGSCDYAINTEPGYHSPFHEDPSSDQFKFNGSCSTRFCKDEKIWADKKDSSDKRSSEGKGDDQLKVGVHASRKDGRFMQKKLAQVSYSENKKLSNGFVSSTTDRAENTPGRAKKETNGHHPQVTACKGSVSDTLPVDASSGDVPKVPKPENLNGGQHSALGGMLGRELDAPSPDKKGSDQAAAKALKEAKDIKHSANRLRDKGLELESTDLYFQASLKFLHAASLLEVCNVESAKHGETTQSMQVYTDTAKLFEFCAIKYEKFKEMAAAALSYKCMEVAHMRVIYCKNYIATRDWRELHASLQVVQPGESPSSSASDVDNLNKGVISPQIAGNHIIAARNRPNFERLLKFARDVDLAMDALRRWQNAFASVKVGAAEARYGLEGISSIKRVLDFSFHDVAGLLRLVRLATEAIGR